MNNPFKYILLALVGLSALLTGCARNIIWDKPGATQQEFNQDSYACTQSSQQYQAPVSTPQPQGQMVGGIYVAPSWTQQLAASMGNSPGGYTTNQNLYRSCIQSKGYVPRQGR